MKKIREFIHWLLQDDEYEESVSETNVQEEKGPDLIMEWRETNDPNILPPE